MKLNSNLELEHKLLIIWDWFCNNWVSNLAVATISVSSFQFASLFIQITKRTGRRVEPWGRLDLTGFEVEERPLLKTWKSLSERWDLINLLIL